METYGNAGRGGRDYTGAASVLDGLLASDDHQPVFPDDYCLKCVLDGKGNQDECFHKHWTVKEAK